MTTSSTPSLSPSSVDSRAEAEAPHPESAPVSRLLAGKKALITGGSRGLGKALCEVFSREGADVAFNYAQCDEGAAHTLDAIEANERKALKYKVSVTDRAGVQDMIRDVTAQFGRIDILVNNAALNRGDSFVTTTEQTWLEIINVNVNGLYYVTKPVLKQMMRQRAGAILNISSIGAIRALPTSVHYATAKAAAIGFTKCLSREAAAFGVNVNCIAAGILDTDLGNSLPDSFKSLYQNWCAKGRMGEARELAEFAAFLVCDRNTYMNGEVVIIDGGTIV